MDTDQLDHDLTEALARGCEPRKLWPALWCFTAAILVLAGVMPAKC